MKEFKDIAKNIPKEDWEELKKKIDEAFKTMKRKKKEIKEDDIEINQQTEKISPYVKLETERKAQLEKQKIKRKVIASELNRPILSGILIEGFGEDALEVSDSAITLLEKIDSGNLDIEDCTHAEQLVLVKYLRDNEGYNIDQISYRLRMNRKKVVQLLNELRQMKAYDLLRMKIPELGGEIFSLGFEAARKALQKGQYKTVAYILSTTVAMLQSIGLIYKMPKRSQIVADIFQKVDYTNDKDIDKFLTVIKGQEDSVEKVLNEALNMLESGVKEVKETEGEVIDLDSKDVLGV